jgi:hypothetical protein
MADIISLNRVKKARDKATAKAEATENRVRFGRTKAQKSADREMTAQVERQLDAHKRGPDRD